MILSNTQSLIVIGGVIVVVICLYILIKIFGKKKEDDKEESEDIIPTIPKEVIKIEVEQPKEENDETIISKEETHGYFKEEVIPRIKSNAQKGYPFETNN